VEDAEEEAEEEAVLLRRRRRRRRSSCGGGGGGGGPPAEEERLLHERVPSSHQHAAAVGVTRARGQRAQAIIHLPRIDISPIERPVASNTLSAIPSKCADGMVSLQAGLTAKLHEHGGRLENKDKEIALRFVSNLVPVHSTHPAHLDHILRSGALMSLARQAEVICRRI
jgi:hypothetical protein